MPGGSPGIPIQRITSGATPNAESRVTRPADMVKADVRSEKDEAAPVPKQYEVINGGRVMWNHMPYQLKPGQVISDHTHDIAAFRRQGIRMQELPPETAAS